MTEFLAHNVHVSIVRRRHDCCFAWTDGASWTLPGCPASLLHPTSSRRTGRDFTCMYLRAPIDPLHRCHLDGARLFNACIAAGVSVERMLRGVDTASVCLSKGLGCPVGSVVVGDEKFMHRARRARKVLGGTLSIDLPRYLPPPPPHTHTHSLSLSSQSLWRYSHLAYR
jgi:hypothetical protein